MFGYLPLPVQAIAAALPVLQALQLSSPGLLPECIGSLTSLTKLTIDEPRRDSPTPRQLPTSITRLQQLQVFEVESDSAGNLPSPASVLWLKQLAELPALRLVSMQFAFLDGLDWVQARASCHAGLGMQCRVLACNAIATLPLAALQASLLLRKNCRQQSFTAGSTSWHCRLLCCRGSPRSPASSWQRASVPIWTHLAAIQTMSACTIHQTNSVTQCSHSRRYASLPQ